MSLHRPADLSDNESQTALLAASGPTLVLGNVADADMLIETAKRSTPMRRILLPSGGRNLLSSGRYEEAEGVFFQGPDFE